MKALLLAAAVPALAGGALERFGLVGRPAPAPLAAPVQTGPAKGEGIVSGHADFACPVRGRAPLKGTVLLSGPVRVTAPGGYSGDVLVSAYEPLSGLCSAGAAAVMQTLIVRGSGRLDGPGGAARRVTVSGRVPLSSSGPAPRLWLRAYVYVK
jgi:hypothetical protein